MSELTLDELLLTREEVVIFDPMKPCFIFPIHPSVMALPIQVRTDHSIAASVLSDILPMYLEDLQGTNVPEYARRNFLEPVLAKKKALFPGIPKDAGRPALFYPQFLGERILYMLFSSGVGLYYAPPTGGDSARIDPLHFATSVSKAREYASEGFYEGRDSFAGRCHGWLTHDVETFPLAVVLRDWCICYHNELLRRALA